MPIRGSPTGEIRVTREEFGRIERALERLAQAQGRTEAGVVRLAEAQARTEVRVGNLEEAMARLAEAQARTEVRVGNLEEAIARLAEAQARTEARVERLEEAQARTDARVERLEEAQARTEAAVQRLAEAQARTEAALAKLATQVGRLSDAIGFSLEDIARTVLPGYLQRHYGMVTGELTREHLRVGDREVEVDLYGEGTQDGQHLIVVGEVKSRIYEREIRQFLDRIADLQVEPDVRLIKTMFGFYVHPSASKVAQQHGVILVASYQR